MKSVDLGVGIVRPIIPASVNSNGKRKGGGARLEKVTTVVIADDEMISRGYMELFIKPSNSYRVIASLPFAEDVLTFCRETEVPDLVILDVMMAEGADGLTVAARIKADWPQTKVIVVTSMADADWIGKAREAGVESFWFKTYSDISLLEVMDRTMAGESIYPGGAPGVKLGVLPASRLTGRQRELLRYLTEGCSNREIAEHMHLSPNTVKDYLDDLMEASELHSRTALAVQASRLGIAVSESERRKNEEMPLTANE